MTVFELVSKLSTYPADTRVTLLDPDRRWLLPIEITALSADGISREVDFIVITADSASDEIEGLAPREKESLKSSTARELYRGAVETQREHAE